jgi:GNAT superfamily N-acetyltransferase
MAEPITIRKLTPGLLPDYLTYFDGPAFADNPEWSDCYCCFHHVPDTTEWEARTAAQNRELAAQLIRSGQFEGFLAYEAERPVGWCKAAARLQIPALSQWPDLAIDDAAQVGSIVCFVIEKSHRRQGIASMLLGAACEAFRQEGLKIAEAYPRITASDDAYNYHGPLQMYLKYGFLKFRELDTFWIVRKSL